MKSVALHNLGCKVNGYEMDVMRQMLEDAGYGVVAFDEIADIYIINTCTVTNIADRKSRQMIHRAKALNPEAVVVAVGCYVQTGGERALLDEGIDLAIGNNRKKDLLPILEEFLSEYKKDGKTDKTLGGKSLIDIGAEADFESMMLQRTAEHTRAYIKIQDGCNQFCSYCIIPFARGRVRSRTAEEILREVRGLAAKGYQEVVLTGIHLSSYGLDLDGKRSVAEGEAFPGFRLLSLIREIQEVEGIKRIRLGSLEPRIITEEFAEELSALYKVCPHFHLSLQSGCDAVLKRMNRKYTAGEYYDKVCILREHFTDPAITTDVIAGFPGETNEEFEITRAFLEKVRFYEMHIFKYSMRRGTAAASMENQVPETEKARRSGRLMELEAHLSRDYRQAHVHKETAVLFEEEKVIGGKRYQIGHSAEYIKAAFPSGEKLSGQIVTGKFGDFLRPDILLFHRQG